MVDLIELLEIGKDVCNSIDTVVVNEDQLVSVLLDYDLKKFTNLTFYYWLNGVAKMAVKTSTFA